MNKCELLLWKSCTVMNQYELEFKIVNWTWIESSNYELKLNWYETIWIILNWYSIVSESVWINMNKCDPIWIHTTVTCDKQLCMENVRKTLYLNTFINIQFQLCLRLTLSLPVPWSRCPAATNYSVASVVWNQNFGMSCLSISTSLRPIDMTYNTPFCIRARKNSTLWRIALLTIHANIGCHCECPFHWHDVPKGFCPCLRLLCK